MKKHFVIGFGLAGLAAHAVAQSDVPQGHWAHEAVEALTKSGILTGYPDGAFRGDRAVTRYELAQVLYRTLRQLDARLKDLERKLERAGAQASQAQNQPPTPLVEAKGDLEELQADIALLKEGYRALAQEVAKAKEVLAVLSQTQTAPSVPAEALKGLEVATQGLQAATQALERLEERVGLLEQAVNGLLQNDPSRVQSALEAISGVLSLHNQDIVSLGERLEAVIEILKNTVRKEDFTKAVGDLEDGLVKAFASLEALEKGLADHEARISKLEAFTREREKDARLKGLSLKGKAEVGTATGVDFDRLSGGDGTKDPELSASPQYEVGFGLALASDPDIQAEVVLKGTPPGLDLGRVSLKRGGAEVSFGQNLPFALTPYLANRDGSQGGTSLTFSVKEGPLSAKGLLDQAANTPKAGEVGLEVMPGIKASLLYLNDGSRFTYGAGLEARAGEFALKGAYLLGALPHAVAELRYVGPLSGAGLELVASYRNLPSLTATATLSDPSFADRVPYHPDQKGFGVKAEALAEGLGEAKAVYQRYTLAGVDYTAFNLALGYQILPQAVVGGFYGVVTAGGVDQGQIPGEGPAQDLEGGYLGGYGAYVKAKDLPLEGFALYGEYRVAPSRSGFTVKASYAATSPLEAKAAFHYTSLAPSPLWKVAASLAYPFALSEARLKPQGLLARTQDGTTLYRFGLEAAWRSLKGLVAYGSFESATTFALSGGLDRVFDPRYPGLYEGVAGSGKATALTAGLEYRGFSLTYWALLKPTRSHAFRLAYEFK